MLVAICFFDQGVNRGTKTVAKQLQKIVRDRFEKRLKVDGRIGPKSLKAINSIDGSQLAFEFIKASQMSYVNIVRRKTSQVVFLRGWIRRSHRLLDKVY